MDAKDKLRQIIREELDTVLEARPGVGRKETRKYTSAGTIPNVKKRKMTKPEISNREQIGQKMLNMFRRGSQSGSQLRQTINYQLGKKNLPIDKKHQYSQIWANASNIALNGGTASSVKQWSPKKKKSKPSSGTSTQQPSSGNTPE